MKRLNLCLLVSVLLAGPMVRAASLEPDARRGAEFFRTQFCVNCHAIAGTGGHSAPDLGRRLDRNYTPAGIASRMWDHAPTMWGQMGEEKIPLPTVRPADAADLFAYFYSVRYFERPAEAERGKELFHAKRCSECHALTGQSVGTPVDKWISLSDPVVLINRMWNHAPQMQKAAGAHNVELPQLTGGDLGDMLVYLQNLPQMRDRPLEFSLPSPEGGAELFEKSGCAGCHSGANSLENRLSDSTLTDVAAAMWNHSSRMLEPHPELTLQAMRKIIAYAWGQQFFNTKGNAATGKKVFETKKCETCHGDPSSGAPALGKPALPYSAISMVSLLWEHGPAMLRKMQEKRIPWPQLTQTDMANLIAYLNSR